MRTLDPALWRRVNAALDEVYAASPEALPELLARLAERDPDAHREVSALLQAGAADTGRFLAATEQAAAAWAQEADSEAAPARLGNWRLVRSIGRGGMGEVYLVERADGSFEQQGALKLLRRGLDSRDLLARFLRERRILARLTHPAIARLLEGGLAPDGRPYFVMEHVAGRPITEHALVRQLDAGARLRLFLEVCAAVEAAHRSLVVHRDLKPSNVLVDDEGRVKLLDFGIAKLLEPDDDDEQTRTELRPLTPAYAAPEQVLGGVVTTATDVFALGVLLHELLVGRRPYERASRGPRGLAATVSEEQLAPPSQTLRRDAAAATSPVERVALERRARGLAGDLDAILARALEADPAARYPTVAELSADLRRHLAGEPVEARPASAAYRARKFAARHRLALLAGTLVAASLLGGLALAAWQAQRASREAQRAAEVQRLVIEIFQGADPTRTLGRSITARAVLDEGLRRVESGLTAQPEVRAELQDTLAQIYANLGLLDEALPLARSSSSAFRGLLGAEHPRTALSDVTHAEVLAARGELGLAEQLLRAALPNIERGKGRGGLEALRARAALADVLHGAGRLEEALALHRAVFEDTRRLLGEDHVQVAVRLGELATGLADLSRFDEAEACLRDALARLARAGGERSPQAIQIQTELADTLDVLGREGEAEQLFERTLEIARQVLGRQHPQVPQILLKQGILLIDRRRLTEAEAALLEAVAILEPLGHYDVGSGLRYLGFCSMARERYAEAQERFGRAEAFLRDKLGADHVLTWSAVGSRAWAQARAGQAAAAEPRLREALQAVERLHGAESREVAYACRYLGEALRLQGRAMEAAQQHRRGLALEQRLYGGDANLAVAATRYQLALDLLLEGGPALGEARGLIDQAVAFIREHDHDPGRLGDMLACSGSIALAQGDRPRARRDLSEALLCLRSVRPLDGPSVQAASAALAKAGA